MNHRIIRHCFETAVRISLAVLLGLMLCCGTAAVYAETQSPDSSAKAESQKPSGSSGAESEQYQYQNPVNPLETEAPRREQTVEGVPYDAAGILTYRSENGEVTIMSCSPKVTGELHVPDMIEGEPVTAINDYAFLYCAGLTSVSLPASVTRIGDFTFSSCTGLTYASFPSGLSNDGTGANIFYGCTALTSIKPSEAFYGSGSGRIHLTASKDSLGARYAAAVPYVYSDDTPPVEGAVFQFWEKDRANESTVSVPSYQMEYQGIVYNITAANEVERVNNMMSNYNWYRNYTLNFYAVVYGRNEKIQPVNLAIESYIPQTRIPVTGIDNSAFINCESLRSVTLGANIEMLGRSVFSGCTNLTSVDLSKTRITSIGGSAFQNCGSLASLSWPPDLSAVGGRAFSGCTSLGTVSFKGTKIKEIEDNAFLGCGLKSVQFIEGLKTIGAKAFQENELTDAYLPASLENIQPDSFDPDVVLHFTGDATSVNYVWVDEFAQVHYDPVLALLLESNQIRIEQFFGEGLEKQGSYFISTETAGLHVPNRTAARSAAENVSGAVNSVSAAVSADGQAVVLPIAEEASAPAAVEAGVPVRDGDDTEGSDEDGADTDLRLFEVVSNIMEDNPFIAAFLVLLAAAFVVMGGMRRYEKSGGGKE